MCTTHTIYSFIWEICSAITITYLFISTHWTEYTYSRAFAFSFSSIAPLNKYLLNTQLTHIHIYTVTRISKASFKFSCAFSTQCQFFFSSIVKHNVNMLLWLCVSLTHTNVSTKKTVCRGVIEKFRFLLNVGCFGKWSIGGQFQWIKNFSFEITPFCIF